MNCISFGAKKKSLNFIIIATKIKALAYCNDLDGTKKEQHKNVPFEANVQKGSKIQFDVIP
jgi:hypothetical protein